MRRCQKCNTPLEGKFSSLLKKVLKKKTDEEAPSVCSQCDPKDENKTSGYMCSICNRSIDEASALTHIKAEEYLLDLIKKDHPQWRDSQGTCPECINYYRDLIKKAKI